MRVLIAEDDQNKRARLVEHVAACVGLENVIQANSLQSAIRTALGGAVSLVVADMSMPTFDIGPDDDGGRPQAYAGRELLRQIKRRRIPVMSVIVTQFDRFGEGADAMTLAELDAVLRSEHGSAYLGAIYYDVRSGDWRRELSAKIAAVDGAYR